MQVYFIGAGPGDPELITVKAVNILKKSDVVIYAGSLVNPEVLRYAPEHAEIHNSASMTLEEVIEVMEKAVKENKLVARVHTGDPAIYGAHKEQMDILDKKGITYKVIPGVSSFLAAAASQSKEFTLPEVSQTVIVTRMAGRTPVPEKESLRSLASHKASMCIFLSVGMMDKVVDELIEGGYTENTPVTIVEKASWPDERSVSGTLADIASKVKEAGITKTAMIMVGDFLDTDYARSKLYDPTFAHEYRGVKA